MNLDIVGIGSALVDVTVNVKDDFLISQDFPKGGMTLIEYDRLKTLMAKFPDDEKKISAGGATSNVMTAFAHCGGRAGFIGKIGPDLIGKFFEKEMKNSKVEFTKLTSNTLKTGVVFTMITEDGERTFATYLGAAASMTKEDISFELLNIAPILHVEAYLIFNKELVQFIFDAATHNKQKISFDLSSFNIVKDNLDFFKEIIKNKIDIVFANEEECKAFTNLSPKEGLEIFSQDCSVTLVKEGAKGSYIKKDKEVLFLPSLKIDVIDTNGAGDAYAGGILFGLSKQLPIDATLQIGTKAGALSVSQQGARLHTKNIQTLNTFASSFL